MKKTTVGIALFMMLPFLIRPICSTAEQAAGPRMVLKEKLFDHGSVEEGAVIEHTYKVANEGDQPLLIRKVEPG